MSATVQTESPEVAAVRVTGVLSQADLLDAQRTVAGLLESRQTISLLVIADGFEGFEASGWSDMSFQQAHDHQIERMAIVAEQKWEDLALLFTGAGLRRVEIKCFPPASIAQARAWLAESDQSS